MLRTLLRHYTSTQPTTHTFKSSTPHLLKIVSTALYSQKQIFIRELVSNASDALEKRRLGGLKALSETAQEKTQKKNITETQMGKGNEMAEPERIEIEAKRAESNSDNNSTAEKTKEDSGAVPETNAEWKGSITIESGDDHITITDTGIGMTEEELHNNLGTIAQSGSRQFKSDEDAKSIIGQFGVGFYSAFMVGDEISVYSRKVGTTKGHLWQSKGDGEYTIQEHDCDFGTKIVIHLRDNAKEFGKKAKLEEIIKTHSNFVSYPILLDGKRVNSVESLWNKTPTEAEHEAFYKFIANAWDKPQYTMTFKTDAPMDLKAVLYIPSQHTETFGMGRMEPGVSLYSRHVLIQKDCNKLLPEWLRFVKGVVDSEDLPLNLSREMLQDSHIFNRINRILTSKLLSQLATEAKKDEAKYSKWHADFGIFIKEGICTTKEDSQKKALAKLVRFRTNKTENTSLEQYVSRMPKSQKSIYYLTAPSAAIAQDSPYLAQFEQNNVEVIFMLEQVDEFVASHLQKFGDFELTHVEKGRTELTSASSEGYMLPKSEWKELESWFSEVLGKAVSSVKVSSDLPETLAGHLGEHESPMMRNLMKQLNRGGMQDPLPVKLELNAHNPIIIGLNAARKEDISEEQIKEMEDVARQVLDSAAISAGVLDDPRSMLKRLNHFCLNAVKGFVPMEATVIEESVSSSQPEAVKAEVNKDEAKAEADAKEMQA